MNNKQLKKVYKLCEQWWNNTDEIIDDTILNLILTMKEQNKTLSDFVKHILNITSINDFRF